MSKTLQQHWLRIIRRWPADNLRAITFQSFMQRRLADRFLKLSDAPQNNVQANEAQASLPSKPDEKVESEQVNALYSLLENRYSRLYPTSEEMMQPASKPSYYADLKAEMEEAPTRSWLRNKWLGLRRRVRFS
ncbi:MAG: hypothetical protein M1831_005261 [Alyxoria varia]|nr:MAG: hypothetical protein M1831_005261 [Alyxoria varia]